MRIGNFTSVLTNLSTALDRTSIAVATTPTEEPVLRCVKAYLYQIYDLDREQQDTHYLTITNLAEDDRVCIIRRIISSSNIHELCRSLPPKCIASFVSYSPASSKCHLQKSVHVVCANPASRKKLLSIHFRRFLKQACREWFSNGDCADATLKRSLCMPS